MSKPKDGIGKVIVDSGRVYVGVDEKPKVGDKALVVGNTTNHQFRIGDIVDVRYVYDDGGVSAKYAGHTWAMNPQDFIVLKPASAGQTVAHDGTEWSLANRRANIGEYVLVVAKTSPDPHHVDVGSIVKITRSAPGGAPGGRVGTTFGGSLMRTDDYLVLAPKQRSFRVGDIVRGNAPDRYFVTNDRSTCKVTKIYKDTHIQVKLVAHPQHNDLLGMTYDVESKYFDLVTAAEDACGGCADTPAPSFKRGDKVRVLVSISPRGNPIDTSKPWTIQDVCDDEFVGIVNGKDYRSVNRTDIQPWVDAPKTPSFERGSKVRAKVSKSVAGNGIDTSVPWYVKYVQGQVHRDLVYISRDPVRRDHDRGVRPDQIEPWTEPTVDHARALKTAQTEFSLAKTACAMAQKRFDEAKKSLQDVNTTLGAAESQMNAAARAALGRGAIVRNNATGELMTVTYVGATVPSLDARTFGGFAKLYTFDEITLVYAADHAIAKSLASRGSDTFRVGDVLTLGSQHPSARKNDRIVREVTTWCGDDISLFLTLQDARDGLGVNVGVNGIGTSGKGAVVKTPVELRTDITDAEKLQALGLA